MSKGWTRRPPSVGQKEWEAAFERTFGKKQTETTTAQAGDPPRPFEDHQQHAEQR